MRCARGLPTRCWVSVPRNHHAGPISGNGLCASRAGERTIPMCNVRPPVETGGARRPVSRILFLPVTTGSGDHFSGTDLAAGLERPTRETSTRVVASSPLFGLSPGGVYPASPVTRTAVRSYRTISPLPLAEAGGGIFSVALSLASRPVAVSNHPDPWSPDFPPRSLAGPGAAARSSHAAGIVSGESGPWQRASAGAIIRDRC